MTGRKRKKDTPAAGLSLLDASTKRLTEYPHDKVTSGKKIKGRTRRLTKESASRHALFEQARDAICVIDENFKIVEINASFASMLGYTLDEALQLSPWDWDVAYPAREKLLTQWPKLPTTPMTFETRFHRKDGTIFDVEVSHTPAEIEDGKVLFLVCRDISERRQIEDLLAAERNLLYTLIDNLPDNVFVKDVDSRIVMDNIAHRRLLGATTLEQVVGKTDFDFFPRELVAPYIADEEKIIKSGEALINREEPVVDRDGNQRWILTTKVPLRDRQGMITGIVGITHDITERKQLEASLRERERHFQLASWAMKDVIWERNFSTNTISWNDSLQKLFHYSADEIEPTVDWWQDHIHPAERLKVIKSIQTAIERGEDFWSKEYRFRLVDGSYANIFDRGYILYNEQGKPAQMIGAMMDITERKQAEEALTQSEQAYRTLFENVPIGLYRTSAEDLLLDANPALIKMLGHKDRESLLAKNFADFYVDPANDEKFRNEMKKGNNPHNFVAKYRRLDGTTFWTEDYTHAVRNEAGVVLFHEGSLIDITERKRAEDIRQARLRLLEFASSHSLDELLTATLDEIETLTGSAISFYHFLESDQKTLLSQNWSTNTLKNTHNAEEKGSHYDIDQAGVWMDCVHERHPVIHNDYATLPYHKGMPEGHAPVVREIIVPIFRGNLIKAIIGVGNKATDYNESDIEIVSQLGDLSWDIVERKRAEEKIRLLNLDLEQRVVERTAQLDAANKELSAALRETEELFSTVQAILTSTHLTQICQSLMEHFINLVKADRITLFLVNHERQEILLNLASGSFSQELPPMTYQELNAGIAGWVFKSGQPILSLSADDGLEPPETYERRIRDNVGSLIVVPLLTREGAGTLRVIGVVIVINSIGQRVFTQHDKDLLMTMATQAATAVENIRLYEEAEKARDVANAANQSKSDFLANMSHEIRTPMNAIIGLTQLVLDTDLNASQQNYLQKVQTSSKALLGILNDILDYSKIEAGKLNLEEVDFDLEETLRNTAELFSIRAEEKEIELVFEIAPEIPLALNGDPLRLGQVLNNLVGNAVKFTERGEIHVKVEVDKIEDRKTWLQFSIRDTGIGMTEKQLERLFHAFSQADTSTTRKFGGTGLGLTISKRLVDMMGGEIGVESVQGQGSVLHFMVPLQPARSDIPLRQIGELRGMKTLVVDDQEASLQVMENLLNSWSFDVTLATSGTKGLQAITKAAQSGHPFELLLIDWKMPGMDGLELARRIQDLLGTQIGRPPLVIMVTAFGREDVSRSVDAIQIDAVLDKPVTPSRLFDLLIDLQNGRAAKFQMTSRTDNLELFEMTRPIHGSHILVVEDNATNQLVAKGFLEKMSLVVDIASDGQEAIDKVASQDYDVILMDLQMPKMDGFEATRRIRSMERGRNLPIISMTAAVMQKDKDASDAAGMNGHLAKPINVDELASVLMKWAPRHPDEERSSPRPKDIPAHSGDATFQATPDFDLNITLSWLRGDRTLLKQILTSFQMDLEKTSHEIRDASEQDNWTALKGIAHKLKGTAGNVGAIALQRQAAKLEAELMEQPNADTSAFEEKIGQALVLCKRFIAETADDHVEKPSASRDEVDKALDELAAILQHNRLIPMKLLEKVQAAQIWGASSKSLKKLRHEANTFNYKKALLALELIRKEMESKQ